eukprot:TRINITY_DN10607_c0_g1_i6.p1 TRINITY_DN10607_c0_g1~~TRINITY_DN10607_c0_g1_i6.p1  ORF type:complete len:217 (+),score=11.97 TRINITY_DN10607_c0_g1_i6:142-792(+)
MMTFSGIYTGFAHGTRYCITDGMKLPEPTFAGSRNKRRPTLLATSARWCPMFIAPSFTVQPGYLSMSVLLFQELPLRGHTLETDIACISLRLPRLALSLIYWALKGGIFFYPADKKNTKGKLRMLYECFPMAYLVEAAGGAASDGRKRILDLTPTDLHERSPIFLGTTEEVRKVEEFYKAMDEVSTVCCSLFTCKPALTCATMQGTLPKPDTELLV